jgi:hypothetical protein
VTDLSNHPVGIVVHNYARQACWLSVLELRSEATIAMIEAARTHDPAKGPLGTYQAQAATYRLQDFIAHQMRPVHFGRGRKPPVALGVGLGAIRVGAVRASGATSIEFRLDLNRAAREVRRILEDRPAAREVLMGERLQTDVARELGLSRWQVVREVQEARRVLRGSATLRELAVGL